MEDSLSYERGGGAPSRSTIGVPLASRPQIAYPRLTYSKPPPYRLIAMFIEGDISDVIRSIQAPGTEAQPGRPLARSDRAAVKLFIRACRVAARADESYELSPVDHPFVDQARAKVTAPAPAGGVAGQDARPT